MRRGTPEQNIQLTPSGGASDQLVAQLRKGLISIKELDITPPATKEAKLRTYARLVLGLDLLGSLSLVRVFVEKVDYRRAGVPSKRPAGQRRGMRRDGLPDTGRQGTEERLARTS